MRRCKVKAFILIFSLHVATIYTFGRFLLTYLAEIYLRIWPDFIGTVGWFLLTKGPKDAMTERIRALKDAQREAKALISCAILLVLLPFLRAKFLDKMKTQGAALGYVLLPFQGEFLAKKKTQGVALGYVLLPFQGARCRYVLLETFGSKL